MRLTANQTANWQDGLAAAFERLVHPSVQDEERRRYQGRLIGQLLVAPFLAGTILVQFLLETPWAQYFPAATCLCFALAWSGALRVAHTGRTGRVGTLALAGLGLLLAPALAAGGILQSPFLLLLIAPSFESWWPRRTGAARGAWFAVGIVFLAAVLAMTHAIPAMQFAAHHWIVPLAYAGTIWLRLTAFGRGEASRAEPSCDEVSRITGALAVRVDRQGNVSEIGGDAEDLLGVRTIVLLGPGLFDRLHVTDRVAFLSMLDTACAGGGKQRLDARLRRAGGEAEPGHVHCHCAILPAAGDAALVLISRHEAAKEQDAAKPGNAAATYLATVSHELRTPLNAIAGFAEMLRTGMCGPLADGRQREYVELIGDSSQHLLSVVDSVLGASHGSKERFCLREAVTLCFSLLGSEARSRNVQLAEAIDPGIGEVLADRHVMQQILINLVANSIRYTPAGGKVTVAAERSGASLILRISDDGIGMAPHEVARAGTPFLRFAPEEGARVDGVGLGLSLVRGLIAMLEGVLEIDSAPGRGTVVTIALPLTVKLRPGDDRKKELEPEHEEERRFA